MSVDVGKLQIGFDGLAVAKDQVFSRIMGERKLHCGGDQGRADVIDDWSARLVCSTLAARGSLFIVLPDAAPRRASLLFASALVLYSAQQLSEHRGGGRVLYVSASSTVREQLAGVSVGTKSLASMYAQDYGRGSAGSLRSAGPASTLPRVLCVAAPAEPGALVRRYSPSWIAVDAEDSIELRWLEELLAAAKAARIPTVGWTSRAFGRCVQGWVQSGGGVFRWPRSSRGHSRVERPAQLLTHRASVEVEPAVLEGEQPTQLSELFTHAAQQLAVAHRNANGRLVRDAVLLGWRYLRSMESLAAPLGVYEAEAASLWGVPCLSRLRADLRRFIDAIHGVPKAQEALTSAAGAMETAHDALASTVDPPLWTAAAKACSLNGSPRRLVFSTRSMRDIFRFALASRFKDDTIALHAADLTYLAAEDQSPASTNPTATELVLVGLPSRYGEARMERLLEGGRLRILLWPHQRDVLQWRMREWNKWFDIGAEGKVPVVVDLNGSGGPSTVGIRLGASSSIMIEAKPATSSTRTLWTAPDAAEAIRDLFSFGTAEESGGDSIDGSGLGTGDEQGTANGHEVVDVATRLCFDDGRSCLVPPTDRVNLVVRGATSMEVQRRGVSGVRPGDVVLLVNGEHRHGLYDLLIGRIHKHPAIAQYVTLVARWHEDLATAYRDAARRGLTPERLLGELRARGSGISCSLTVRNWLDQLVRAPNDAEDLRRLAEVLSMPFVAKYYRQVHTAARKLWGLHISLSVKLNRWLETETAGRAALSDAEHMIDEQLGLTLEDFRHSLMPLRVREVRQEPGPFLRSQLGRLEGSTR